MIAVEDGLDIYLKEVSKFPVLSREDEQRLFADMRGGSEAARQEIIRCNLRFVVKMSLRYQNQGVALPDLIQEGNMGLMEVIDKFDPDRGFRFSTYAAFWIKQSIQQAICKQSRLIRLPIRKSRMIGKINEFIKTFSKREGREPNVDEIANMVELPPDRVEQLERMNEPALSLESARDEDGPALENMLPQSDVASPIDSAIKGQMKQRVRQALENLTDREQRILSLRFGLVGGRALSLRNTSAYVGLSQEGVRRVEKKALEKLRRAPLKPLIADLI
jgi:RNA polymerase primary sigma factor